MNKKQIKKSTSFTFCFIFFLIFMFILNIISRDKNFSQSENRFLSQRPKFSIDKLLEGRFTSKFEDYLSDQFVGRDFFTDIKIHTDELLGKRESHQVFLCKDNYLIEDFTKPDEKYVKENLKSINNFANKYKSINQYMLISPTAISIFKDKLPFDAPVIDQEKYLKSYENKLNNNLVFVNPYQTLYSHKDEYIFYKTDHHWTSLGANYAYQDLSKAMKL